ncbi:MAG: hypothetical protein ACRCSQ_00390 [Bacteroidales bacterium]
MKYNVLKLFASIGLMIIAFSCNTESETSEVISEDNEVSFSINIGDYNQTKNGGQEVALCNPNDIPDKVSIKVEKKSGTQGKYSVGHIFEGELDVIQTGSGFKTSPFVLDPGVY